jgi:CRP/FNR family transcriptional regulator
MACEVESCSVLQHTFFARMPSEQVARLGCVFHLARYRKNQVIFTEGGSTHQILALRSGLVKLVKLLENGKERIVRVVFPGELFGFEGLTEAVYALSAIALSDSEICAASPDELFGFLRQDPEIALGMVRFLVGEVGRIRSQVTEMSFKDARMKLATFLLTLAQSNNTPSPKGYAIILPFSRLEISEILELSPETVSRVLSTFKRERLVEARGRRLTIRDRSGLEKAAQR